MYIIISEVSLISMGLDHSNRQIDKATWTFLRLDMHGTQYEGGIYSDVRQWHFLRIDNSGWSVNSSALFDGAGMRWYQRKYHVLYTIRQTIINSIY